MKKLQTPTPTQLRRVRHVCLGGNRCCLRDEPSQPSARHMLCICSDPRCECHSRERYEAARQITAGAKARGRGQIRLLRAE